MLSEAVCYNDKWKRYLQPPRCENIRRAKITWKENVFIVKKLGIIGFGGMAGGHHMRAVSMPDVPFEAIAAYDIDPARLAAARECGLRAYDNLDEFLAGDYDLVLVATANNYHCEMTCSALEAGFNVMVEKPAAMSSAELETMIAAAERCGKLFTVHHNRRFDADFMKIRQAIEEGAVGRPFMIESRIHAINGSGDMYNWRAMEDHGGGMLYDWGVHMLDQLLYMIQEPLRTVSATVRSLWSAEVDDYSKVILTFESGLVAQMEVSTYAPIGLPRWYVLGDRGAMTMQDGGDATAHVRRINEDAMTAYNAPAFIDSKVMMRSMERHMIREFEEFEAPASVPAGGWPSIYKNIAGVLDGTEELIVKPAEVLRVFRVMEAAKKSSREGIMVQF